MISSQEIKNLSLEDQNTELRNQLSKLKDIKLNSLEMKLDKSIDMLNELQNYLVESRIATSYVSKLISGHSLSDDELKAERMKMEASKYGK